jgi:O-acetylserine/cysteine efflux transporter
VGVGQTTASILGGLHGSSSPAVKFSDSLIALCVVAIWGINFSLIRLGLQGVPPLLLCAMRFFLVFFPLVFFVRFPKAPWRSVVAYGMFYFGFQFSCLFTAIHWGFPAGLSSLVLQTQVFFTMGLSSLFFREKPSLPKVVGALIAFSGIALVGLKSSAEATPATLALMLLAAFSFASGNIVSRAIKGAEPLALVIWGSLAAFPLLLLASFVFEGPSAMGAALVGLTFKSVFSLAYIAYLSTLLAFSLWSGLLRRIPSALVAPFTLLVPVFGFLSAAVLFGEPFGFWKSVASVLVITGVAVGQVPNRWWFPKK